MSFPPRSVLLRLSNTGSPLNAEAVQNGVLILPSVALPKGYKSGDPLFHLHFQLNAASPVTVNASFYTNAPESGASFKRSQFQKHAIDSSFDRDTVISVPIYSPGSYCYYIEYEDDKATSHYYFNVPPNLAIDGTYLPFNNINIQSVVSKWIGDLPSWDPLFTEVSRKGYNMIHFTPLQERGVSNSPYSIFDQLKFDPELFKSNEHATEFIHEVLGNHNLLSLTDVVWNHTADNSEWLRDHPDAGYNVETAPHLRAAIELDAKLLEYSSKLEELGFPTEIKSLEDLNVIISGLSEHVIDPLELWQFYVFDKTSIIREMKQVYEDSSSKINPIEIPSDVDISNIEQVAQYSLKVSNEEREIVLLDRFSNKLNAQKFIEVVVSLLHNETVNDFSAIEKKAGTIIDEINVNLYKAYDDDIKTIKSQVFDRVKFQRLDDNGEKMGPITKSKPLTDPYFTRFEGNQDKKSWALANNGWIWGGNPLVDFASSKSKAYLRREVIIWGDCVKLRYGENEEDSPYLWKRMIDYTKLCAKVFNGFRIDNCHSTPLHVGERLLDEARLVNPNLYVVAELFSGSEAMDKIFVERLGINSLIREAMQAWSVSELSTLVHKHGGRPLGSLTWMPLDDFAYPADKEVESSTDPDSFGTATEMEIPKNLASQAPHALFMDCTHDNEVPAQKRTVEDTLPNAALVAFCSAAIGSVLGYDECYPELLNVVHETRKYTYGDNGIGAIKKRLHAIRKELAEESVDAVQDNEMYIHHEGQYITIQRHNSRTGKGWFLIARTKFSNNYDAQTLTPPVLGGTHVKGEFAYTLKRTGDSEKNEKYLTGIPVEADEIAIPSIEFTDNESRIHVDEAKFVPGSIAVFSTTIPHVDLSLDSLIKNGAVKASCGLDFYDLNAILYKCESEERDASHGSEGTYEIPRYGKLTFAGLEGWIVVLKKVIWENNLGHAICDHLREGEWAFDYVVNRLDKYAKNSKGVAEFQGWLRDRIDSIRAIPYFLRPHYFALVVGIAYEACRFRALRLMDPKIQTATNFVQRLALTSVQMVGNMNNTSLKATEQVPCIAAGLPHFSNDYMRCWGRDVFISFRGLFLVTGRDEDAKQHILGFAQTLKHGLIPNLLDAGRNPRYNARDAAWFFAQAVQEYVVNVSNGIDILEEKVTRRFPLDDTYIPYDDERAFSYETSIGDILYEILSRHAKGIKYREANAGPNLDSQMTDEGFNVEVNIDWETGLVHGGSQFNCGTWMDKMGESEKAKSKGVPGTPRDGAAVELQGLLKSTLRFVNELNAKGKFPYTEVEKNDGSKISLKDWEQLVQDNFEKCFHVPEDPSEDGDFKVDPSIVNRRGIYKDLYLSGKPYEDYQLRPNFAIAMRVAPELFSPERALAALNLADKVIRGPLGMRTLDPSDYNYHPYYRNSEDSTDFATSKGRNYHQGPEWVWCIGYFFRAYLYFTHLQEKKNGTQGPSQEVLRSLNERLQPHINWIKESPWSGLTELTNKDAEYCDDSSPTQAWSTSCLLDLYYDLWTDEHYQ
ncbi:glycogen debranching enzyme [[Candida] anglica]|uniref:Glycogen debranching enzyme n=1 Tax=[Candida] anglica TaxID=148631 RepID=A0ABP0EDT9_9ASCO